MGSVFYVFVCILIMVDGVGKSHPIAFAENLRKPHFKAIAALLAPRRRQGDPRVSAPCEA
jgi:hypothetical protein